MAEYLKHDGGSTIVKYPYTYKDLRNDNPNISFPQDPALVDYTVYNVAQIVQNPDPAYDPKTHKLEQGTPTGSGDSWSVTRVAIPLTADELKAVERQEDTDALAADPQAEAMLNARPAQINNYIETNVTDMESAKEVMKILARAIAIMSARIW